MEGIGTARRMLPLLRGAGAFHDDPFVLIDVGCGGGIDLAWREFGDNLVAHGFDPVRSECRRLQARESLPGVKYHSRLVGLPPDHELYSLPNCVIVPHIASATVGTRDAMAKICADNLLAGLGGKRLPHCVNPEVYRA